MMIFRKRGKLVKSKISLLQSKKLYADPLQYVEEDPYIRRFGLGRLLVTEFEHAGLVAEKVLVFDITSKYQAFKKGADQQMGMEHFERRFGIRMYYLFYNPVKIPHKSKMPLTKLPELGLNKVGCRVVLKKDLDVAISTKAKGYTPSFSDLKSMLPAPFVAENVSGWRLEHFAGDLMLDCKEGMIDNSPTFETMLELMNQKSRPMSSAVSITFDMP